MSYVIYNRIQKFWILHAKLLSFHSIYPVMPSIKGGNMTSEVTVLLGNLMTLECEVRGVPLPAITWYKNGVVILSSRQAQYVDRGQFLKISRAQVSDAGQYTCKVTSVAGTAEKVYVLDVYGEDSHNKKSFISRPVNF